MDYMIGQTSLNKFKKIEIVSRIFSDHRDLKPETPQGKNFKKPTDLITED